MRVQKIFIEHEIIESAYAKHILKALGTHQPIIIDNYEDYFNRIHKPYLDKTGGQNIYIARKRGELVKAAPPAYGFGADVPHYYFIHAYNCVYECDYCFLQGYFQSPDIVWFVNHDEILQRIAEIANATNGQTWFHAGEFSDSLAMSHITGELPLYFDFFRKHPQLFLELRTKSVNVRAIEMLSPAENIVISFSLSPETQALRHDNKAPPVRARCRAIARLASKGFKIGIHFDPLIYSLSFASDFSQTARYLQEALPNHALAYISLGVVRFAEQHFTHFRKNYPESAIFSAGFHKAPYEKMKYPRVLRNSYLNTAREILREMGYDNQKIYYCME